MNKSDITERKFIESFDIDEWEIETPEGWQDISSIHKTVEYKIWVITFDNGTVIKCADTHIFIDEYGEEIYAKDSLNKRIKAKNGIVSVISVEETDEWDNMYDVTVNSDSHVYYTNDICSHNSISVAAFMLHYLLFNENKFIAILAHKAEGAREILSRIQLMYEHLPQWLQQGVCDWNKGSFTLENGSKIIATATSSSAIRGRSCNVVYCDEFAFIPKNMADDFINSVYPTISSGKTTKFIVTSTPYGLNHFYKMYNDAVEGRNEFKYIRVPWNKVPGRDEEWKQKTIANIGEESFLQEYDIQFIGSAGTLIDPAVLRSLSYTSPCNNSTKEMKIYKAPERGHLYVMTVDTSEGLGLDYSVAMMFDVTKIPYEQVALYRSNTIDPLLLPEVLQKFSHTYLDASILCELNSVGTLVTSILWNDLEFEPLLWVTNRGAKGQILGGGFSARSQMGLKTTPLTKKLGCSVAKTLIENEQLIVYDYQTILELSTYVREGATYQAQPGCHDDTVSCIVILGWLVKQPRFQDMLSGDHDIKARLHKEALLSAEEVLTPFGVFNDGVDSNLESSEAKQKSHEQFHNGGSSGFLF